MSNAVTRMEQPVSQEVVPAVMTPMAIVQLALDKNFDLERIEKMMQIAERFQKQQSERAFNQAVSAFKQNPPQFFADKENKQYGSKYTSLGNMVNVVNAALGQHGLEASWDIEQTNGIKVTCILRHADGHERRVSLTAAPDKSGAKNEIQQIKSTITYLEVATFQAVTGVATSIGSLDDDGNGAGDPHGAPRISAEQVEALKKLIAERGADVPKFLAYIKADTVEGIRASSYEAARSALQSKRPK